MLFLLRGHNNYENTDKIQGLLAVVTEKVAVLFVVFF